MSFKFLLNCIDHYQSAPSVYDPPLFGDPKSSQIRNAPHLAVIRAFGATETGQRVCAHIHGALPYLFIEYRGGLEKNAVNEYIHQIHGAIDHALAVSYRRNLYDGKTAFVGHISIVKGVPFFGYHVGYRYFLKIYLLNPSNMTRLADLLHQGAVLKTVFQPFESHLQFLLQWMCDFNLYGCAYVECSTVKFRQPVPRYLDLEGTQRQWHDRTISPESISSAENFPKQSHCALEIDICVQDILNRSEVRMRDQHADFVERFHPQNPEEKLVQSLSGLWRDETRRRKLRMGLKDPSSSPFPAEVLISMSANSRTNENGGWIHEEEFRKLVDRLIHDESLNDTEATTFEEFIKHDPQAQNIPTVLESVEDLFIERFSPNNSFSVVTTQDFVDNEQAQEVDDESANIEDEAFYGSDEEIAREIALTQRAQETVHSQDPSNQDSNQKSSVSSFPRPDGKGINDLSEHEKWRLSRYNGAAYSSAMYNSRDMTSVDCLDLSPGQYPQKRQKANFGQHSGNKLSDIAIEHSQPQDLERAESANIEIMKVIPNQMTSNIQNEAKVVESGFDQLSQRKTRAHDGIMTETSILNVTRHNSLHQHNNTLKQNEAVRVNPLTPSNKLLFQSVDRSAKATIARTMSTSASPFSYSQLLSSGLATVSKNLSKSFPAVNNKKTLIVGQLPPNKSDIFGTLSNWRIPSILYQDAFFSDGRDVPERPRDYAGREFKLESNTVPYLNAFDPKARLAALTTHQNPVNIDEAIDVQALDRKREICQLRNWEFYASPPTVIMVQDWLKQEQRESSSQKIAYSTRPKAPVSVKNQQYASQISGPTQKNKHDGNFQQKRKSTSVKHRIQYMSILSLEVHVNTRGNYVPNPAEDEIVCVFWCIKLDEDDSQSAATHKNYLTGILVLAEEGNSLQAISQESGVTVEEESTELDLLNRVVDLVRQLDPDILTGYEVHNSSWGYLIERARLKYEFDLCDELSRMKSHSHGRFGKEADRWGFNHTSTIRVTGRHMINIWRAMRAELNLLQYTMENVAFHLLHTRIPHYSFHDLTNWYKSSKTRDLGKCLKYFLSRTRLNLDILDANELVPRTSEQARLIGVDFYSVFSRGSQFKVESFMFRIAKPENFLLVSPSRKQVGQQNALECLPLVMEPQSAFYNSPLLVLDFQSLYPSIMIAYNYCYSTCLGRLVNWRGQNKMGFADFKRQPKLLGLVKDSINIAPNGIMYVKPEMRKSLLAKMLGEILETRVMVKSGMKVDKDDKMLQQLLNNRQLALKLLANVTYGYTSASFSGRMPCAEIADSIVQTGREILERAIAHIHSVEEWGAEVVYGDTDSLFVYLRGRTKDEAFDIGSKIAQAITDTNPRPIKLKFEKVYLPCVLLAKKRYVGFKYESKQQTEPDFDAKGIETVRRDGTPAEQKIEEKALKILFHTADLSQVKNYFVEQCAKIMLGKVSIQDFCFAREVKLGTYADKGPPPPGALISTKRMLEDPRTEPQYGERVPYVVITGGPKSRLIDRCVAPEQLLKEKGGELDAEYYISKNLIPPLERIFNLVGANVRQWYDEMPKTQRIRDLSAMAAILMDGGSTTGQAYGKTLESYLRSSNCVVCRSKLEPQSMTDNDSITSLALCQACARNPSTSLYRLQTRLTTTQRKAASSETVCRDCSGISWTEEVRCDSKDCPVFYTRIKARSKERRLREMVSTVGPFLEENAEW